jgi:hypothetical protein
MADCIPLVFDNYNPSEEDTMAKLFCHAANKYFEDIEGKIYAMPSLETEREIDLVIWMEFPKYKTSIKTGYKSIDSDSGDFETKVFKSKKDVWFRSSLFILELKKHNTSDSISIRNGKLYTLQKDGLHNTTQQSFDQVHPLINFLAEKLSIPKSDLPRVTNMIWLYKCTNYKPEGYEDVENLILGDISFDSLLEQLCRLNLPVEYSNNPGNFQYKSGSESTLTKMNLFLEDRRKEKGIGMGKISRDKLNNIIRKDIDVEHSSYFKNISEKLIVIKGNPGTGKTIHLINLAYHSRESEFSPIVLTFNKALSQDIDRLMEYSGFGGLITINTLHQFFIQLLIRNGLIEEINSQIFQNDYYINLLVQLFELIKDIDSDLKIRKELGIDFDLVFVDEAQDCEEIERDLIYKIFGISNCIISIGNRQIVRKKKSEIRWALGTNKDERQVVNLKISHRNKKDLTDWFNEFSNSHFGLKPWELKENRNLHGGKLILLKTNDYNKAFHLQLDNNLIENENSKYDLMFLTPNKASILNYNSEISEKLKSWSFKCFDNNIEENKNKKFPIDAYRILNYQSCRGLEAWTLVLWNLDIIIQNISANYINDFPDSTKTDITEHINNWLLMIFTRAIDTLVITFNNYESEEYKMIEKLTKSDDFGHMAEIKNCD